MGLHVWLTQRKKTRGQSLVEFALFLPIFLILFSGLVEMGYAINMYINIVEAVREGARYGADNDPTQRDIVNPGDVGYPDYVNTGLPSSNMRCEDPNPQNATTDYYAKIYCVISATVKPAVFDPEFDWVRMSVYRVYRDPLGVQAPSILETWPNPAHSPSISQLAGKWLWGGGGTGVITQQDIQAYINSNTLSSAILVVEAGYQYQTLMNLPWVTFLFGTDGTIEFRTFTIIPVSAGEPRPTATITPPPPTPLPTSTPVPCSGNGLSREIWTGIAGSSVSDLLAATSNLSTSPNVTQTVSSGGFRVTSFGDSYGQRLSGLVCVNVVENYTFWIASDDNASLRLNTTRIGNPADVTDWNALAAGATEIARVSGFTNDLEWNKNVGEQRSAPIFLTRGYYYIEVLHKEGSGGDHAAVSWRAGNPTTPANGDSSFLIPSNQLVARLLPPPPPATETPTPTPSNTPIGAPTETPTITPTPTATFTPEPCVPNRVSAQNSYLSVQEPRFLWADNTEETRITVVLRDNCGTGNPMADPAYGPSDINLLVSPSDREPGQNGDVFIFDQQIGNDTFVWRVRSRKPGVSYYSALVADVAGAAKTISLIPPPDSQVSYTCLQGNQQPVANPNLLQIYYEMPPFPFTQIQKRLTRLVVNWPANGSRFLSSVAFGQTGNVIWSNPPSGTNASPLDVADGNPAPNTWANQNRTVFISSGRSLQILFNYEQNQPGLSHTVQATWDDGTGNRVCSSPSLTLP